MILLSSLLGPAKPPVASRDDVASAPGVFSVQRIGGNLIAVAVNGRDQVQISPGERCLVCLCDYELDEEVRQLASCAHVFHRECIDEVNHVWIYINENADVDTAVVDHRTQFLSTLPRAGCRREDPDKTEFAFSSEQSLDISWVSLALNNRFTSYLQGSHFLNYYGTVFYISPVSILS